VELAYAAVPAHSFDRRFLFRILVQHDVWFPLCYATFLTGDVLVQWSVSAFLMTSVVSLAREEKRYGPGMPLRVLNGDDPDWPLHFVPLVDPIEANDMAPILLHKAPYLR
jgi:hypothetical protein